MGQILNQTDATGRANGVFKLTSVSGADAIVSAALPDGFVALADLQAFVFESVGANTGAVTLDIGDGVARAVTHIGGAALIAGDIPAADTLVECFYDVSANDFHAILIRQPSSTTPAQPSTGGTIGAGTRYSRSDHAHPAQCDVTYYFGTNPAPISGVGVYSYAKTNGATDGVGLSVTVTPNAGADTGFCYGVRATVNTAHAGGQNICFRAYSGGGSQNYTFYGDGTGPIYNSANIRTGGKLQTDGGAVIFPATQVASAGANDLDDYEEGTWSPNQGSGLTVVGAFSSSGSYTKIGDLVTVRGRLSGATSISASSAGQLCANLPFVVSGTSPDLWMGSMGNAGTTAGAFAMASPSTTVAWSTGIAATSHVVFTLTYKAA